MADSQFAKLLEDHPFGFFADPMTLRPLKPWLPIVQADWMPNARDMRLSKPVAFIDPNGHIWRAATGRVVDGMSSPRLLWRIQPPFVGRGREGSVIHDVACVDKLRPSSEVHWVFWCAMRARRMSPWEAWWRWAGTRVRGPRFRGTAK